MKFNRRNLFLLSPTAENAGNGAPAVKPIELTAISYQAILDMKPEHQDALMKKFNARVTGLKETQKDVKTESKYAAILLAGVEQRVKHGIEAQVFASTFTVSDLYKQITGEKPPGHVYTLKCAFVVYVLSTKISEADYLGNRNNCLELAQKIADAVIEQKHPEGLQHDAVTRAAAELKSRNENEAKVLRGILASVKPAKLMTAEEALEAFTEICASGNLPVCLAQMPDEIVRMNEDQQRESYIACGRTLEKVETALGEKAEGWMQEAVNAQAPVTITNGDAPAASAPETPAAETDDESARLEAEMAIAE